MLTRAPNRLAATRYGWRVHDLAQTYGSASTETTPSAYTSHAFGLVFKRPAIIEKVLIDLKAAGTYTLVALSQSIVVTVAEATANAEFVFSPPAFTAGGPLSFTCTAGSAVQWGRTATIDASSCELFDLLSCKYDGSAVAYGLDWRFVARPGTHADEIAGPRQRDSLDAGPLVNDREFTLSFLSDLGDQSAAIMLAQANWLINNQTLWSIPLVVCSGDLVGTPTSVPDWVKADAMIDVLDAAEMPYVLTLGNHDYDSGGVDTRETTIWNTYFPQSRYTAHAWWSGGFYEAAHSENLYLLQTIGSVDYLFIGLELYPRQAVVDWALALMDTYSTRQVIVVTHAFLNYTGLRVRAGDLYDADAYFSADYHNGTDLWSEIRTKGNLLAVLSGHFVDGYGAWRQDTSTHANAQTVHQVFANYQNYTAGGNGYLRLLRFKPALNEIEMLAYSPVEDAYRRAWGETGRWPLAVTR